MTPFNVIFMGTPDFAVPSLNALHHSNCHVTLVVTQPDRPKGRGRQVSETPVKQAAKAFGYDFLQPDSVRTDDFYHTLRNHQPDLLVVIAFGHILPKRVLELPPYGAINLHASLLPKYRGPAPIQWAIINGEPETGVTSMLMDKGLDTGEMLVVRKTPIYPQDTAGDLHDRLAELSAEALIDTLEGFSDGTVHPTPQNHAEATYAPLLTKADGRIEWSQPAEYLERFIRGMTPWPGAYTFWGEKRLKLFQAEVRPLSEDRPPGTVVKGVHGELRIAAGKDALSILEIQGASGKRMGIADFLKGAAIPPGSIFK